MNASIKDQQFREHMENLGSAGRRRDETGNWYKDLRKAVEIGAYSTRVFNNEEEATTERSTV